MFITKDSFFGEIEIGQRNDSSVKSSIDNFISQYEEEYLKGILGYQTKKQFIESLISENPEQKWLDLLNGCEFIKKDLSIEKFEGFVSSSDPVVIKSVGQQIDIYVGRGNEGDPVDGSSSYTNSSLASFLGDWKLSKPGYGILPTSSYSKRPNGFDLLEGLVMSSGEIWSIVSVSSSIQVAGVNSIIKRSPISYFVYYWYSRVNSTSTTGTGETIINKVNSQPVTSRRKQSLAWNKMVDINKVLVEMMSLRPLDYPEFIIYSKKRTPEYLNLLSYQNILNL